MNSEKPWFSTSRGAVTPKEAHTSQAVLTGI